MIDSVPMRQQFDNSDSVNNTHFDNIYKQVKNDERKFRMCNFLLLTFPLYFSLLLHSKSSRNKILSWSRLYRDITHSDRCIPNRS